MVKSVSIETSASAVDVCAACGTVISGNRVAIRKHGAAATPAKKKAARKPQRTPEMLNRRDVCTGVKIDMIAAVPGVSRAKAAAVLEACEGSFAQLVGASATKLAGTVCGGTPIGNKLGVAIFRSLH